ncbi:maestro heat-like repeat-containing protein family member 1 [Lemur catta]|uniref:maestro heat-like repeat-containing protein family member 1 n=1 Tax=Lemur catta TaxID=9447 RepID=UPI001E26C90D|nr:maestro heat-like repeat-containing protein family member 1 [Lemur catta]
MGRTRREPGLAAPAQCSRVDHTEKSLDQDDWEDRLLQFSSQSLVAINDDRWLEQLDMAILERIKNGKDNEEQKAFLYKFFGFTLRTSKNLKLVQMMLSAVLHTSHEELREREVRHRLQERGSLGDSEAGWRDGQELRPGKPDSPGWNFSSAAY